MKDPSSQHSNFGWLLTRDGHAVPITGFSPDELKASRKAAVPYPETEMRHNQGLTWIVSCLGFDGDFGCYTKSGWPRLRRLLDTHDCQERGSLFPEGPHPFFLSRYSGPTRRQLADRIFASGRPRPQRVFLGYGIDWDEWFRRGDRLAPAPLDGSLFEVYRSKFGVEGALLAHRHCFSMDWGFLDDKLIAGPVSEVVTKTYLIADEDRAQREHTLRTLIKAFREVFPESGPGWVDIVKVTDRFVVLRAHDGTWDAVWADLRESPPPVAESLSTRYKLHAEDVPSKLMTAADRERSLYFRRGRTTEPPQPAPWKEQEDHAAEEHFYAVGHSADQRRRTSDAEVLHRYLVDTGVRPRVAPSTVESVPGFKRVEVGGKTLLVSELITVGDVEEMLTETGYLLRRHENDEALDRANQGEEASAPAGLTWRDAQAFCAWLERRRGVTLRLPTPEELRAIRPLYSDWYQGLTRLDFPWEYAPPRPLRGSEGREGRPVPSAVRWSEPRFHEAEGQNRKRWILNFPPSARWVSPLPWASYRGLQFIDAWDAYEWCEGGIISGRFWEGELGLGSWGAYKNVKVGVRFVVARGSEVEQ